MANQQHSQLHDYADNPMSRGEFLASLPLAIFGLYQIANGIAYLQTEKFEEDQTYDFKVDLLTTLQSIFENYDQVSNLSLFLEFGIDEPDEDLRIYRIVYQTSDDTIIESVDDLRFRFFDITDWTEDQRNSPEFTSTTESLASIPNLLAIINLETFQPLKVDINFEEGISQEYFEDTRQIIGDLELEGEFIFKARPREALEYRKGINLSLSIDGETDLPIITKVFTAHEDNGLSYRLNAGLTMSDDELTYSAQIANYDNADKLQSIVVLPAQPDDLAEQLFNSLEKAWFSSLQINKEM